LSASASFSSYDFFSAIGIFFCSAASCFASLSAFFFSSLAIFLAKASSFVFSAA
jgi:hypothetical protein